jgi:tetratricopeptide (TPR) repeat protein
MASRESLYALVIAIVAFAAFANSLNGGFVYDDKRQILMNPLVQNRELFSKALISDVWAFKGDGIIAASNYYRPAFVLWLIVNFAIFGTDPFGWHLANVLLHIFVCVTAYFLLKRLDLSAELAFATAGIFAVHPVHSESVAWISGSPDLLMSLACLGSLILILRPKPTLWQKFLSVGLYAFAVASKEIAFFLVPLYFIAFWSRRDDVSSGSVRPPVFQMVPYAVASGIFFFVRFFVLGGLRHPVEDAVGGTSALLTVPTLFVFYLGQLLFPLSISISYPLRPVAAFSIEEFVLPSILATAGVAGMYYAARRTKSGIFGLALFILSLIPVLDLTVFPSEQIVHDRYLYLPLLGLLMVVIPSLRGLLSARIVPYKPFADALVLITIISLSIVTILNNKVWESDLTLWQHTARIDPHSAFVNAQLGNAYAESGFQRQAVEAFDASLAVRPTAAALLGQGQVLASLGENARSISNARLIIEMPRSSLNAYTLFQSYELLAVTLMAQGNANEAEQILRAGREELPIYEAAMTEKLAVVLYNQKRKKEALSELQNHRTRARIELLPVSKTVFLRLGMLYAEFGDRSSAIESLNEFLRYTSGSYYPGIQSDRQEASELLRRLQ